MRKYFVLFLFLIFCSAGLYAQKISHDSITVTRIWDKAPHNAFGDIIRFRNAFYVSFREGISHVGGVNSGKARILRSKDGANWESVALLQTDAVDLRDPKLSITPGNQIMITMAGAVFENSVIKELFPMVSFSDKKGKRFSDPERAVLDPSIAPSRDWIWRVTWHNGIGYAIDYQLKENDRNRKLLKKDAWLVYLMKTTDGKRYEKVSLLEVENLPNESTIRFDKNGKMYVMVRREAGDQMGVLATSNAPYHNWNYSKLDFRLGGPDFLFLNDNTLVMGTRLYGEQTATGILITDLEGRILKTITLPSGGDTSYPGMLFFKDKLWVVYYSSHEGKAQIYLAKIPLKKLETENEG
jgi:hypothetical protein